MCGIFADQRNFGSNNILIPDHDQLEREYILLLLPHFRTIYYCTCPIRIPGRILAVTCSFAAIPLPDTSMHAVAGVRGETFNSVSTSISVVAASATVPTASIASYWRMLPVNTEEIRPHFVRCLDWDFIASLQLSSQPYVFSTRRYLANERAVGPKDKGPHSIIT